MGKIVDLEDEKKKAEVTKTQLENNTRKVCSNLFIIYFNKVIQLVCNSTISDIYG